MSQEILIKLTVIRCFPLLTNVTCVHQIQTVDEQYQFFLEIGTFDTFISCSYVTWSTPAAPTNTYCVYITLSTLVNC